MSFTTKKQCAVQCNVEEEPLDFSVADLHQIDNTIKSYQSPNVKHICRSQLQVPVVTPTSDNTTPQNKAFKKT